MSGDDKYKKPILFLFGRRNPSVVPAADANARIQKLQVTDYRLETAKIIESIEATIMLLETQHKEDPRTNTKPDSTYLKQAEEVRQKRKDLGIDEAVRVVASATMKRSQDQETMDKVDASMARIKEMVEFLASIKPDVKEQRFDDRSKPNRINILSNIQNGVSWVADRFLSVLMRRVDSQRNKANKKNRSKA